MQTYPESQNLPSLLEQARQEGSIRIQREDGQTFLLMPEKIIHSPLDVAGIDLDISKEEIIKFIHEGRKGL